MQGIQVFFIVESLVYNGTVMLGGCYEKNLFPLILKVIRVFMADPNYTF